MTDRPGFFQYLFKEKNLVRGLLFLLLLYFSYLAVFSESIYGYSDLYTHYFISHYAFKYPHLFLNHWGKPLFIALSAPFSQMGLIGLQFFNILLSLASAYLAFLICKELRLKYAWLSILLLCSAPIYFVMAYSGMTEILFGFVLILAVFMFIKEKYIFTAVLVSLIPYARTEGTVFIPLFAFAFLYKRKWLPVLFLFSGFIFYSTLGFFYNGNFLWFFNENPYTGAYDIYGKGSLWHFTNSYAEIFGFGLTVLILLGFIAYILQLASKKTRNSFSFLEAYIILLPPLIYFAGHSFVWWKGIYGSVGLTRVMAGIIPLTAVIGVKGFNLLLPLFEKHKKALIVLVIFLIGLLVCQPFVIYKIPLVNGPEENVLDEVSAWIRRKKIDDHKIFCLNQYVFYKAGVNPFDDKKAFASLPRAEQITKILKPGEILIWDSHFGYNEGQLDIKTLLQNNYLELIGFFVPEEKFNTLGNIPYEVYVFQRTSDTTHLENTLILKNLKENYFTKKLIYLNTFSHSTDPNADTTHGGCYKIIKEKEFSPGMDTLFYNLNLNKNTRVEVSVDVLPCDANSTDSIDFVASIYYESKNYLYEYKTINFNKLNKNVWNTISNNFVIPEVHQKNAVFKVYLWNKNKTEVLMDNLNVSVLQRNL